ncbi:hypothetical protein [Microbacterium sp. NPDC087589]|uniref:hypothetical protein n=1 Tax=Microbacterium sp. NPDC087589 TaxID=3364191 RepID=UPI0037FC7C55
MSTPDEITQLLESVQPASDAVFDALDVAAPALDRAFGAEGPLASIEKYSSTRTHVARALVHRELEILEDGTMGGWRLVKNPGPNCPVRLANGSHSIRVLHTWAPEVVPPSGRNPTRVSYYSNSLLELDPNVLFAAHNFLLLWERQGEEFKLRLVHTLGSVRLNRNAPLDLNVYLERGVSFADMKFEQRDEELEYFGQEAEEEDEVENG